MAGVKVTVLKTNNVTSATENLGQT